MFVTHLFLPYFLFLSSNSSVGTGHTWKRKKELLVVMRVKMKFLSIGDSSFFFALASVDNDLGTSFCVNNFFIAPWWQWWSSGQRARYLLQVWVPLKATFLFCELFEKNEMALPMWLYNMCHWLQLPCSQIDRTHGHGPSFILCLFKNLEDIVFV